MISSHGTPSDFFLGLDRAMVSLGPLSPKRFCTFNCSFCYVHADFGKYPRLSVDEIESWLRENIDKYSIVYISGDTDSFAKPRAKEAVDLVRRIIALKKDALFTTRAALDDSSVLELSDLAEKARRQGTMLVGCISISRLRSAPHIEPKPVPDPQTRLALLQKLKTGGLTTILSVRPFLPIIPPEEYCEIVRLAHPHADAVLGEVWYFDEAGQLESQVLGPGKRVAEYKEEILDFDTTNVRWRTWEAAGAQAAVEECCHQLGVPFFMRSAPAIDYLRALQRTV